MTEQLRETLSARDYLRCEEQFSKTGQWPSRLAQGGHWPRPPRFTIVIPAYKKPRQLAWAVRSALAQPGEDYQVMVVDDAGEPGPDTPMARQLAGLACSRLLYYQNEKNLGLFANWNRCLTLARSEWVVMLHDDDLLQPNYLPWLRRAVAQKPDAGLFAVEKGTFCWQDGQPARRQKPFEGGSVRMRPVRMAELQFGPAIVWQGACIRREAFLQMGGMRLGDRMVRGEAIGGLYDEDYCAMVRFASRFACWRLKAPLYCNGLGVNASQNVEEWQDALTEQYYCSRFLARRYRLLAPAARLASGDRILRLARKYDRGDSYIGLAAGIDLDQLAADCGLPAASPTPAMRLGSAVWQLYDRAARWASHRQDVRLG